MNWLKDHVWLSNWLAVVAAVVIAVIENLRNKATAVNWPRLVIYFAFLSCLAVAFTPMFDQMARVVAEIVLLVSLVFIFIDGVRGWK